jgi:hypothetical protein
MNWTPIRITETSFLWKTYNCSSPGSDTIPNYWLKAFPVTHSYITKIFKTITEEHKQMSDWLTTEVMYLFPKREGTKETSKYRTITCFAIVYKLVTGIIDRRNSSHLEEHSLLPAVQKWCHSGSKGCKDIKTIFDDYRKIRKNLSIPWIDYWKAFILFHTDGSRSQYNG